MTLSSRCKQLTENRELGGPPDQSRCLGAAADDSSGLQRRIPVQFGPVHGYVTETHASLQSRINLRFWKYQAPSILAKVLR